jgi:hypothetical protein
MKKSVNNTVEYFYKVQRKSDGLFYNPDRPALKRCEKRFDQDGKRYYIRKHAENAVRDLADTVNKSWSGPFENSRQVTQKPQDCEIKTYRAIIEEIK